MNGAGRNNSIMMIHPYKEFGVWVFDDAETGLVKEPFVSGMPEIIDAWARLAGIENPHRGITILFSATPFPGHQHRLIHDAEESEGNWYVWNEMRGWLCPALFKYFHSAPHSIYALIKKKESHDR